MTDEGVSVPAPRGRRVAYLDSPSSPSPVAVLADPCAIIRSSRYERKDGNE